MKRKKVIGLVIIMGVLILVMFFVGKVYMNKKVNEKLENQKQAAISLRNEYKDLEEIVFNKDGGNDSGTENDFGTWYINVKIKISNEWYEIATGKDGGAYGGIPKKFPEDKIGGKTTNPTKVKYSNGKEEILE